MPRWAPNEVRDFCKTDAAGGEVVEGGDAAVASVGAGVSPGVEAGEDDHDFLCHNLLYYTVKK